MKFNDLLEMYENKIKNIRVRINYMVSSNNDENKYFDATAISEWVGRLKGALELFNNLKSFCDDYESIINGRNPNKKEKTIYKMDDCELVKMLDYRGYSIAVFFDDYGQQYIAQIPTRDGQKTYSLGAFNCFMDDALYMFDVYNDLDGLSLN